MKRVFSISDLHVDYKQNMDWVRNLSSSDYTNDVLIIAGDISDDLMNFSELMGLVINKFACVFFVPGNHDLWIRKKQVADSLQKFYLLMDICSAIGVHTKSLKLEESGSTIQIQPLFSWYVQPHEGADSLYLEKPGEDSTLSMWADKRAIKWPEMNGHKNAAQLFLKMNEWQLGQTDSAPVITFSHFLPRQDLIFSTNFSISQMSKYKDPAPRFNFSRVAGTSDLEKQIREINPAVHIYGHQHRNRFRTIDEITYISHGLGYPKERHWAGINDQDYLPRLIWDSQTGFKNENPD